MNLRLPKCVRSVTLIAPDASGRLVVTNIHESEKATKGSRRLRPVEKTVRRAAEAEKAFTEAYLHGHKRSNEKKRDGWLKDLGENVMRADTKRRKKFGMLENLVKVFL